MAGKLFVILSGYDTIKEAFINRADEFSDRAPFFFNEVTGMRNKGIIFANGKNWREQRTVTMSILRSFGMGKNILADMIQTEVEAFVELVVSLKGHPTDMRINTNMSTANIISALLLGRRFEYDDDDFRQLVVKLRNLVGDQTAKDIINFLPFLGKLPGDYFGVRRLVENSKEVNEFFLNRFVRKSEQDRFERDNFVSAYMEERERRLKTGDETLMDEENLVKVISDIFLAGTESTSTNLLWCMFYAITHQDVQRKIYDEIERVIGGERRPTIQDKTKLVYLNAFILEVQRVASINGLGFTHLNPSEVTLRGFKIPKDSFIISNIDSIMYDEKIWGDDVMCCKPERFLTGDQKLKIPEQFIPFSTGRRVCPGEGLANTAVFLYMANLFQRFKLLPKDVSSPPEIKYVFGLDVVPVPFEVCFIDRLI